jgi:hypothetical protein
VFPGQYINDRGKSVYVGKYGLTHNKNLRFAHLLPVTIPAGEGRQQVSKTEMLARHRDVTPGLREQATTSYHVSVVWSTPIRANHHPG